jgi:hypothetical protein
MTKRFVLATVCTIALLFGGSVPQSSLPHWSAVVSAQKTVHVKAYTKKDGTVVAAHERSRPKSTTEKPATTAKTTKTSKPQAATVASSTRRSTACETCPRDEHGRILRSGTSKGLFMKLTGYPKGRPGYVVDHIIPLACGGPDMPTNMQWSTVAEGKAKDRWERKTCR